ncbi:MAG: hypothetical protein JHC93_07955 [Parachlamydiales bacterium]|nr:hypothetical protein [Parachlamydiales bacterium]
MNSNIRSLDPFQNLHSDIVQNHIIPEIIFEPNIFSVSKKWNETLTDPKTWKNLLKNHSFIRKEDANLSSTNPQKALFLDKKLRSAISNNSYSTTRDSFNDENCVKYGFLGDNLLVQKLMPLSDNTSELYKYNNDTHSYDQIYSNVQAFETSGDTLVYLTADFELYRQKKDAPATLLHNNVKKLDNDKLCDTITSSKLSKIIVFKDKYVCQIDDSNWVHVIDDLGNKLSKGLPQFSALTTFKNYIVIATNDYNINFYDENLNLHRSFDVNNSIDTLIVYKGSLVSAGCRQSIKLWDDNGDYTNLSPSTNVRYLNVMGDRLISSYCGNIKMWNEDQTCFKIKREDVFNISNSRMTINENVIYLSSCKLIFG